MYIGKRSKDVKASDEEIKMCNTVQRLKKILKKKMLNKYKSEACMALQIGMWTDIVCVIILHVI